MKNMRKKTFGKRILVDILACTSGYRCQNFRRPLGIVRGGDGLVAESAVPKKAVCAPLHWSKFL